VPVSDEHGAGDRYVDNLRHFSLRDFMLGGDDDLVLAFDSRLTSAHQLRGSQAGQHDELKGTDTRRAANHDAHLGERRCTKTNTNGM